VNFEMRYNFGCSIARHHDNVAGIDRAWRVESSFQGTA